MEEGRGGEGGRGREREGVRGSIRYVGKWRREEWEMGERERERDREGASGSISDFLMLMD